MTGKVVRCIFNFPAETEADLEINIGDVIRVTKIISNDWYEGQIHNRKGQFPAAFVEECNDVFDLAIATRSFSGEQEGDLSFENEDYIVVTEIVDENWMRGYVQGGGYGLFPRLFVKQISLDPSNLDLSVIAENPPEIVNGLSATAIDTPTAASETSAEVAVDDSADVAEPDMWVDVLENFNAMDSTELNLVAGKKVKVLCDVDDFWCKGVSENGEEGIFPRNFVDLPELVEEKDVKSIEVEPITEPKVEEPENITTTETKVEETVQVKKESNEVKVIGRTVALFNFAGTQKGDLSFNRGDEVLLLENINAEWMRGKINDSIGIFPSNYVEVVEMYSLNETKMLKKGISISEGTEDGSDNIYENVEPLQTTTVKDQSNSISSVNKVAATNQNELSSDPSTSKTISPRTISPPPAIKKKPPPKPLKPQRPKLPDSKKALDEASPFSYEFKTKSKPIVIIPPKYRKQGSPNIIVLKNWKKEELEEMRKGRGN